jgi:hypothetical protein
MAGESKEVQKKEAPSAIGCAIVLVAHAIFLSACGCWGASSKGWAKEVMHSAYAGVGSGASLVLCAILTISGNFKLYMIGVHLALLLQGLFVLVFGIQSFRSFGVPSKEDRFPLFVVMCIGSLMMLVQMILLKPKKKKEETKKKES